MQIKSSNMINFLDVLVPKKKLALTTKVYRKSNHTGCYLNFAFSHPLYVKKGVV
jgi:hypothetical protein